MRASKWRRRVPIDLVLDTPGDSPRPLSIAKVSREHKAKVMVFVPQYAMSGGTLIALVPTKSRWTNIPCWVRSIRNWGLAVRLADEGRRGKPVPENRQPGIDPGRCRRKAIAQV
jgi:hypothetical protein